MIVDLAARNFVMRDVTKVAERTHSLIRLTRARPRSTSCHTLHPAPAAATPCASRALRADARESTAPTR